MSPFRGYRWFRLFDVLLCITILLASTLLAVVSFQKASKDNLSIRNSHRATVGRTRITIPDLCWS